MDEKSTPTKGTQLRVPKDTLVPFPMDAIKGNAQTVFLQKFVIVHAQIVRFGCLIWEQPEEQHKGRSRSL